MTISNSPAPRIRWEDNEHRWDDGGSILGHVGTFDGWLFQIAQASSDPGDEALALMLQLPGVSVAEISQGGNPEAIKAEAERWLSGFVASLGAIFPEGECPECGFRPPTHTHDKNCSRYPPGYRRNSGRGIEP